MPVMQILSFQIQITRPGKSLPLRDHVARNARRDDEYPHFDISVSFTWVKHAGV